MLSFVALGDSITAGLGDGISMGRDHHGAGELAGRGWAARAARSLRGDGTDGPYGNGVMFVNLSTTGATTAKVRREQLPAALRLGPAVASLVAGANDVLRPRFDALAARQNLIWSIERLRASGAVVLTATLPDPARLVWLPIGARGRLTARVEAVNAAVSAAAAGDPGVVVVDLRAQAFMYEASSFDVDRIHPSRRGHQLMARVFTEALRSAGVPVRALPVVPPELAPPGSLERARWLAGVGVPWLVGRAMTPLRRHVEAERSYQGGTDRYGSQLRWGVVARDGFHSLP
jgi:lysophospholipase L1-like esterase